MCELGKDEPLRVHHENVSLHPLSSSPLPCSLLPSTQQKKWRMLLRTISPSYCKLLFLWLENGRAHWRCECHQVGSEQVAPRFLFRWLHCKGQNRISSHRKILSFLNLRYLWTSNLQIYISIDLRQQVWTFNQDKCVHNLQAHQKEVYTIRCVKYTESRQWVPICYWV